MDYFSHKTFRQFTDYYLHSVSHDHSRTQAHDFIYQGSPYILGYYNIDCNTDDDIHRINMNRIIHRIWLSCHSIFIIFVSQTDYLLTHIFPQIHTNTHIYIYTQTRTNVVSTYWQPHTLVALLWRAGRVLYEGLIRWLRYFLDREIDPIRETISSHSS